MPRPFNPGELWQAVRPFVDVGAERLGEDRVEQLNADQSGLALVYQPDEGTVRMMYYAPADGDAVEMHQGGPGTLPEGVREQFDRFIGAGMERLDDAVRQRALQQMEEGARLMAVLDFTARNLKGVIVPGEGEMVELFSLALE